MRTKSGMLIDARLHDMPHADAGIWHCAVSVSGGRTVRSVLFSGARALALTFSDSDSRLYAYAVQPQNTKERKHLSAWRREWDLDLDFLDAVEMGKAYCISTGEIVDYTVV